MAHNTDQATDGRPCRRGCCSSHSFHKPTAKHILRKEGKRERQAKKRGTVDSRVFFKKKEEEMFCTLSS